MENDLETVIAAAGFFGLRARTEVPADWVSNSITWTVLCVDVDKIGSQEHR